MRKILFKEISSLSEQVLFGTEYATVFDWPTKTKYAYATVKSQFVMSIWAGVLFTYHNIKEL